MKASALVFAAAFAALVAESMAAMADAVDVGWRERAELHVASGDTATQTGRVSVDSTGKLYKTGGGTLVLPVSSVVQAQPFEIGVLGGTLVVAPAGDAPAVQRPAVVDEKAALWLDAASPNLLTTVGETYRPEVHGSDTLVSEWLDARASSASDARYLRATPIWWAGSGSTHLAAEGIAPAVVSAYGKTGVWFGGKIDDNGTAKASGQSLLLKSASQATDSPSAATGTALEFTPIQGIFHAFVVQAVSNHYGHILGNYRDTTAGIRDFYSTYDPASPILQNGGTSFAGAMDTGRVFIDGVSVDPYVETMGAHKGLHLLEFELTDRPAQFQAFFRDSTQSATAGLLRNGGDYLFETVIFTNKLTEAQRGEIRAYLMDKWGVAAPGASSATAKLEGGAVAVSAAGSGAMLTLAGTGSVALDPVAGTAAPADSSVVAVVAAGSTVNAESGLYGDVLSGGAAESDAFAKTGRGRVAVAAIPTDATTVRVDGGVLRIAPSATTPEAVESVAAEPPDASFESYATHANILKAENGRVTIANKAKSTGGWLREDQTGAYNQSVTMYNYYNCTAAKFSSWPAPDGIVAMYVKGEGSQVTATITPPASGVYEFSFFASGRQGYLAKSNRNRIEFYIGESEESIVKFGQLTKSDSPYYRLYYRTPRLEGGKEYKLRIRSKVLADDQVDGTVDFDDIRLRLVPDSELDLAAVPFPNGDFEDTVDLLSPSLSAANTATGWEFASESTFGNGTAPGAVLVEQGISAYNRDYNTYYGTKTSPFARAFYSVYDCAGEDVRGFVQLGLFGNGGVARSTSSFVPPAGKYRLRLAAARRSTISFNGQNISGAPILEAKIKVGDGAATSVGSLTVLSHALAPIEFPSVIEVDGTQEVALELRQTKTNGGALVDDIELVPEQENLVTNGSFEDCTLRADGYSYNVAGWGRDNRADGAPAGYSSSTVWEKNDRDVKNYGDNVADGIMRVKIRGRSEIYQEGIALSAGFYRLGFFAESRHAQDSAEIDRYGRNPVRAFLTSGTTTNDIGWTFVDTTNFVEHSFLFRVPESGVYTLHLQGMSEPGSDWGWGSGTADDRMAHLDAVSLKSVPADEVPETIPGIAADASVLVAKGARLELEFSGTQKIGELKLGSRRAYGIVSAATHPEYLSGPGSFEVPQQAFVLVVR